MYTERYQPKTKCVNFDEINKTVKAPIKHRIKGQDENESGKDLGVAYGLKQQKSFYRTRVSQTALPFTGGIERALKTAKRFLIHIQKSKSWFADAQENGPVETD